MKSVNDYQTGAAVMASPATGAIATTAVRVIGMVVHAGVDDGEIHAYNATATSTADGDIVLFAATGTTETFYMGPNGIRFGTGLACKSAGTSPVAKIFYVTE